MQWRQVGPFRGGRALAIEGGAGRTETLVLWRGCGRSLENAGWRRELDAAL